MNDTMQPNPGGLAPAERRCHYTLGNGHTCRDWALRGREHCFRHDRFVHARPERPVDVPLLETEADVVFVLSQTLQALAWGTIPVSNGRMLLAGCRLAHAIHTQRAATAKLRLRAGAGIAEQELFAGTSDPAAPCPDTQCSDTESPCPDPAAGCPDPEPAPNPVKTPPNEVHFRDLRKDWNKELLRSGNAVEAVYMRRPGETREDFEAARSTPFDHLAAIDCEVEQARALATSL